MQQYNDPSFFNYEYQKYKAHLAGSTDEDPSAPSTPAAITRNVSEVSEDRNQEDISNLEQASGSQSAMQSNTAA